MKKISRVVGVAAVSFGAGVVLTFFVSPKLLVAVEAAVILCAGLMILLSRECGR